MFARNNAQFLLASREYSGGMAPLFEFVNAHRPVAPNLGGQQLREKRARQCKIRDMHVKGAEKVTRTGNLVVEKCIFCEAQEWS